MNEKKFKYTCFCCGHEQQVNFNIGTVCPICLWEYDQSEQGDDPYAIGNNGCHIDDYYSAWIRAGKPNGKPRWLWNEEIN